MHDIWLKSNYFFYRKHILMKSKPQDGNWWREVKVALFKRKIKDLLIYAVYEISTMQIIKFCRNGWKPYCNLMDMQLFWIFFVIFIAIFFCINVIKIEIFSFVINWWYRRMVNTSKHHWHWNGNFKCSIDMKVVFLWIGSAL